MGWKTRKAVVRGPCQVSSRVPPSLLFIPTWLETQISMRDHLVHFHERLAHG